MGKYARAIITGAVITVVLYILLMTVGVRGGALGFGFVGLAAAQNKREIVPVTVVEGRVVAYRAAVSMGMGKNTIKVDRDDQVQTLTEDLRRMKMVAPA